MQNSVPYDVNVVRSNFPALQDDQVFLDNAGGSQVLNTVIDSVSQYLSKTNVQLGATYRTSVISTNAYNGGVKAVAEYVNADPTEIVFGSSTTQLFRNLSLSLLPQLFAGDELVISELDHEANIAPWVQLAEWRGLTVRWWTAKDKSNPRLEAADLKALISQKTKLVTCTHASNILGTITNIRAIADVVHTIPGAKLCVDGVAFAPHRAVDMKALGVDFYSFSWYKVYGPHIAMLYAAQSAQDSAMTSLGHFFKSGADLEEKLGLAGGNYECVQALPHVVSYLRDQQWARMSAHEVELQETLLNYLRNKQEQGILRICGEPSSDPRLRVSVIAFVLHYGSSQSLVESVEKKSEFGFRWGHFYSKRLMSNVLGLGDDGVVRVSMVHYNTIEEVKRLISAIDQEISTMQVSVSGSS